jgi:hypothetical protein
VRPLSVGIALAGALLLMGAGFAGAPLLFSNGGVSQGVLSSLDCEGSTINCTNSASAGTLTVRAAPDPAYSVGGVGSAPHYIAISPCQVGGGIYFQYVGLSTPAFNSSTSSVLAPGDGRCYAAYATAAGATAGHVSGWTADQYEISLSFHPRSVFRIYPYSSITSQRYWVALDHPGGTSLSASNGHVPPLSSAAWTTPYIGVGYDSATNGGRWVFSSSDGTNETGIDTGVSLASNTGYTIDLDCTNYPMSCKVGINGTYVTKTLNLPVSETSDNNNMLGVEAFSVLTATGTGQIALGPVAMNY